ncbi:MAG: hypothetical protein M5U32_18855 [Myxococcota bacterium]|nr:hypothetical protein [Myxococcota bacterium]
MRVAARYGFGRIVPAWIVPDRIVPGRIGRGLSAAVVLLVTASLAAAEPIEQEDPGAFAFAVAGVLPWADASGFQELSDAELRDARGRFLVCGTSTLRRRRVILWDEHRSVELPSPLASADPRNQVETSSARPPPIGLLRP